MASTLGTKIASLPEVLGVREGLTAKLFSSARKERNFFVSLPFYLPLRLITTAKCGRIRGGEHNDTVITLRFPRFCATHLISFFPVIPFQQ
jgi:hypothetical protein